MGKRGPCYHCGVTSTPLWRNGPPDKPVLCNACGSRWRTKGSLVNYTPLHCRVESLVYGDSKGKGAKHHNRKQSEDDKVFRRIGSVALYQEAMDEEVFSNRSSSGSAISESDAWFGSMITGDLTGPAESVVQEPPEPSRKRMCMDRAKHSSIKNFAKYLHTILQEQQSSCFSGATLDEDLLLERQMPMGSAEFGHGSALIQHRNESTLEDYEKSGIGGSNLRRNPIGGKRTRDIKNHGVSARDPSSRTRSTTTSTSPPSSSSAISPISPASPPKISSSGTPTSISVSMSPPPALSTSTLGSLTSSFPSPSSSALPIAPLPNPPVSALEPLSFPKPEILKNTTAGRRGNARGSNSDGPQ